MYVRTRLEELGPTPQTAQFRAFIAYIKDKSKAEPQASAQSPSQFQAPSASKEFRMNQIGENSFVETLSMNPDGNCLVNSLNYFNSGRPQPLSREEAIEVRSELATGITHDDTMNYKDEILTVLQYGSLFSKDPETNKLQAAELLATATRPPDVEMYRALMRVPDTFCGEPEIDAFCAQKSKIVTVLRVVGNKVEEVSVHGASDDGRKVAFKELANLPPWLRDLITNEAHLLVFKDNHYEPAARGRSRMLSA